MALFDDPFAVPNPFGDPFGVGAQLPPPRRQPAVPPLDPNQEEGLFSKIGSGALHGLGYLGGVLDKTFGGRAIRGGLNMLMGGNTPTSELLSFLPGSDTLGITNPENSVSGAELVGGNKDTPLLSGEGLGGLAAEVLLDPSTYLTFGGSALTGLGKTAAKAGIKPASGALRAAGLAGQDAEKLARFMSLGERAGPIAPKAIADVAGKSLGGHVGVGLPFLGNFATFDLSQPLSQAGSVLSQLPGSSLAKSAINKAGEVLAPLKQGFGSLFDASKKGQIDPVLQEVAQKVTQNTPEALYSNRGQLTGLTEEIQRLAGWKPGTAWSPEMQSKANELGKQFRLAVERTPSDLPEATKALMNSLPPETISAINAGNVAGIPEGIVQAVQAAKEHADTIASHSPVLSGVQPEILDLAKRARQMFDEQLASDRAAGFLTEPLKKPGVAGPEYATRAGVQFEGGPKAGAGGHAVQLPAEEVAKRDKLLANLYTEGPGSVNWLTGTQEGKAIQQLPIQEAQQEILKKMFGWSDEMLNEQIDLANKKFQNLGDAGEARLSELFRKQQTPVPAGPWQEAFNRERMAGKSAEEAIAAADKVAPQEWINTGSKLTGDSGEAATFTSKTGKQYTIDVRPELVKGLKGEDATALRVTAHDAAGNEVGRVLFDRRGNIRGAGASGVNYTAGGLSVNAEHQGEGIAKAMYDFAQNQLESLGREHEVYGKIVPSAEQTASVLSGGERGGGKAIWESNAERASKNFQTLTNLEQGEFDILSRKKANVLLPEEAKRLKQLEGMSDQAHGLAEWQKKLDLDALEKTGGFFGNHPLADAEKYLESRAINRLNAGAAYEAIPKLATAESAGAVPVQKLLENLGLSKKNLDPSVLDKFVPEEQARALTNWIRPSVAPQGAKPWLQWIDSLTNLTKAGQTSWPATQMRNILSDVYNRFAYGGSPLSPLADAKAFREGQTIPGIAARLGMEGATDAEATKQLAREMYQLGIADTKKFQALDVAGVNPARETSARGMPLIGVPPKGLVETLKGHIPTKADLTSFEGSRLNPFEVRGVGGRAESKFAPVAAAQSAQAYAEEMNRMATYIDARSRGFNPVAAMGEVTKAHLDFSNLTNFEKNVMRRLVPFYSWSRQNLPNVASEIASNPGGRMAQTLRLMNAGTDNGFLPENITQTGYAIPVGQDQSGRQNYLTGLGLPFEDLANLTSLQNVMGSTSPFVRLPYELATGRQTFTGQNLPATFPIEGNPTINALLMNSPLSRAFTTYRSIGRGLEGDRYWPIVMQTLAGPRITNVDPLAARRAAVRQLAEQRLGVLPEINRFEDLSVRPGQLPNLTPQELELLQLYNAVNRRQRATSPAR